MVAYHQSGVPLCDDITGMATTSACKLAVVTVANRPQSTVRFAMKWGAGNHGGIDRLRAVNAVVILSPQAVRHLMYDSTCAPTVSPIRIRNSTGKMISTGNYSRTTIDITGIDPLRIDRAPLDY
jgi:hypothetical protein